MAARRGLADRDIEITRLQLTIGKRVTRILELERFADVAAREVNAITNVAREAAEKAQAEIADLRARLERAQVSAAAPASVPGMHNDWMHVSEI